MSEERKEATFGEDSLPPEAVLDVIKSTLADPATNVLDVVRASCRSFVDARAVAGTADTTVSADGVAAFAAELLADLDAFKAKGQEDVPIPLRFANVDAAIDFYCVLHMLNFGSGFRHLLHEANGRGAYMTILAFMMGLYMTEDNLNASTLSKVTPAKVMELSSLSSTAEVEIMPGVYQAKPGPLKPLVDMITDALVSAGKALTGLGMVGFSHLVREAVSGADRPSAANVVRALVLHIPAFRDVYVFSGTPVWLCKKAQIAVAHLHRALGGDNPDLLHFHDLPAMTVFSDNVVPSVLRTKGVIAHSESLTKLIDGRGELVAGAGETEIRAAAVVACGRVVEALPDAGVTEVDLDYYLWGMGKADGFRSVERHATRNTMMY